MGEFEDKLNSILSSPEDMKKILGLAREIGGEGAPKDEGGAKAPDLSSLGDIDPKLFRIISRVMGEYASAKDDKTALAASLKPYLREERRSDLDRAVKAARIARAAKAALTELSGEGKK